MLKFYYTPISVNARRVWVALLEKQIAFEPLMLKLDGDQHQPDFTAINPLQRIPVIIDDGFRIVESLAILDYLEAKYPTPALMPQTAQAIATVRMVQMIAVNEIQPATIPLLKQLVQVEVTPAEINQSTERINTVLQFYEQLLGENLYFAGDQLTLADVVAGTLVPALPLFGLSLEAYPYLTAWCDRLSQRQSWQQTTPSPEMVAAAMSNIKNILMSR